MQLMFDNVKKCSCHIDWAKDPTPGTWHLTVETAPKKGQRLKYTGVLSFHSAITSVLSNIEWSGMAGHIDVNEHVRLTREHYENYFDGDCWLRLKVARKRILLLLEESRYALIDLVHVDVVGQIIMMIWRLWLEVRVDDGNYECWWWRWWFIDDDSSCRVQLCRGSISIHQSLICSNLLFHLHNTLTQSTTH